MNLEKRKKKVFFNKIMNFAYINMLEDQHNIKQSIWLQLLSQYNNSEQEKLLIPKTDHFWINWERQTEGQARKRTNLFTMNYHKFTKIGEMLYQTNSNIELYKH